MRGIGDTGPGTGRDGADGADGAGPNPHDSGGRLWSGRSLPGTGFDGDTGDADPTLLLALQAPGDEPALMRAVAQARLLVPVVASVPVASTTKSGEAGPPVDSAADMASVTLTAPSGERALPAFSSVAALAAWDRAARPVPVTAARAAQAAVSERCDVLVLDLGTETCVVLRPSMVWALAQQRPWLPAASDPVVLEAVCRAGEREPDVVAAGTEEGEPAGAGVLRVTLAVRPGLDAAALEALATRVGERLATDGEVRARIDAVTFAIVPA